MRVKFYLTHFNKPKLLPTCQSSSEASVVESPEVYRAETVWIHADFTSIRFATQYEDFDTLRDSIGAH
jgi:hypothetical protein